MKRSYEEYSESRRSVREQCTEILCIYSSFTKKERRISVLIFIHLLPCSVISFSRSVGRRKARDS